MSRTLLFSIVIGLATLGCKKDSEGGGGGGGTSGGGGGGAPAPAAKLVEVDGSVGGESFAGVKLMAPEGAVAKEDFGALSVSDGKGFQLEVHSGPADIANRKKEIESNDINKLKRYITDAPDAVVYESDPGMGGKQVHFIAGVKLGDAEFYCENTKGPTYNQAQVEAMLASCRSLKK
jgi:hypothetical protein